MRLGYFLLPFLFLTFAARTEAAIRFTKEVHRPPALRGLEVHVKKPLTGTKTPAVLLFGGFETGARAIDLFEPPVPVHLLTFEYPFTPPRKLTFPGGLRYLGEAKRAVHQTLEGIEKLIDWTAAQPGVDPSRIVLVGASFGAPFVSVAAGNKPEVRGLILAHGFARIPFVIASRLGDSLERKYGRPGRWLGWGLGHFLAWYGDLPDPEDYLARMRKNQSVLLLTARDDDLLPPEAVGALRSALGRSEARWEEKIFPGAHLRPGDDAVVDRLMRESLEWMERL